MDQAKPLQAKQMQRETLALTASAAGGAFYIGGIAAILAGVSTGGLLFFGIIPASVVALAAGRR